MSVTVDQVAGQVVRLEEVITQQASTISGLATRLADAEKALGAQEDELLRVGRRGTGERDREGPAENSELADKKFFTPPILKIKSVFRDWTEEFVEYLEERMPSFQSSSSSQQRRSRSSLPWETPRRW